MNRNRAILLSAALSGLFLAGCGTSHAERREMLDAEWAITNARADEITAEYNRRMQQAQKTAEREAAIQWRMDELSKNFDDHYRRTGELSAQWREDD